MKNNPDNRKDNVERIQKNITMTIKNMREAEEMIEKTDDETMKRQLKEKNERRREALEGFRDEIRDEADYRERTND